MTNTKLCKAEKPNRNEYYNMPAMRYKTAKINKLIGCDWCVDDTCECYWEVNIHGRKRNRICNCCYTHLKKVE